MDLGFTHVYEHARRKMDLSRDEYALCNYVATWAAYPASARQGWCNRTFHQKADFIGITERGVKKMQARMVDVGLIEKDTETAHTRTTLAWWETINQAKDRELSFSFGEGDKELSSLGQGTKFTRHRELSSLDTGNLVPLHNKRLIIRKDNKDIDIVAQTDFVEIIINFLNEKLQPTRPFGVQAKKTVESINARLSEKYSLSDALIVIEHKVSQWKGDARMEQYIRPETLFGKEKFEGYVVAARNWEAQGKPSQNQNQKNGISNGQHTSINPNSIAGAFSDC